LLVPITSRIPPLPLGFFPGTVIWPLFVLLCRHLPWRTRVHSSSLVEPNSHLTCTIACHMHEMEGLVHKTGKCKLEPYSFCTVSNIQHLMLELYQNTICFLNFLNTVLLTIVSPCILNFCSQVEKISRIICWSKFMKSAVLVFCASVLMSFVLLGLYRLWI
jgi:hypothetical protein